MNQLTGYLCGSYAGSFSEFASPVQLQGSKGWILQRQVPGFKYNDAMGCYPLFACQDWTKLHTDLQDLQETLVTLSLVTDPFGNYDENYLRCCFSDVMIPFKEHFVIDLRRPIETFVPNHHRRQARKALKNLCVERCKHPSAFIEDWASLYGRLVERHDIKGMATFSIRAFEKQLRVPGIVAFRAEHQHKTVGMLLWYVQGKVCYYHLGAHSDLGYEMRASFGLFWIAIQYFAASGLQWINLGGGAGLCDDGKDGLSRFKRGWSTGTRTAYFCGRILDHAKYAEIVDSKRIGTTGYFPRYRKGEFA